MRIHFKYNYGNEFKELLQEHFAERIFFSFGEITNTNDDIEIIVGGRPSETDIKLCKNLKKLIIPYAGLPINTRKLLLKNPHIEVHNLHHNALSVAEYAVTFLLSCVKDIIPAHQQLKQNNWSIRYGENPSGFISDKTLLLLGMGEISQKIAIFVQGMNMKILAVNRSGKNKTKLPIDVYPITDLEKILPRADFLISSLPLTDETENLFDDIMFENMKDGAVIVNVGRANVFCEEALFNALESEKIKSAYFDVWYNYPTTIEARSNCQPTNLPFHELNNFYFSPHRSGGLGIPDLEQIRAEHLIKYINLYLEGENLPHKVDLELGY